MLLVSNAYKNLLKLIKPVNNCVIRVNGVFNQYSYVHLEDKETDESVLNKIENLDKNFNGNFLIKKCYQRNHPWKKEKWRCI